MLLSCSNTRLELDHLLCKLPSHQSTWRDRVTLHATSCTPSLLGTTWTVLLQCPVRPLHEIVDDRTVHARAVGLQLEMLSTTPISIAVVSKTRIGHKTDAGHVGTVMHNAPRSRQVLYWRLSVINVAWFVSTALLPTNSFSMMVAKMVYTQTRLELDIYSLLTTTSRMCLLTVCHGSSLSRLTKLKT